MSGAGEARRQQGLLQALSGAHLAVDPSALGLRETGARAARGVQAYLANRRAIAARALQASCPTVHAMVGVDDFERLAWEYWNTHPPVRGDLGEWGEELPSWLQSHGGLVAWPWLADTARLDLAVHHAERAADARLNVQDLSLLGSADPARLRIQWVPGTAVMDSPWPLASIHDAHQAMGDDAEHRFEGVRRQIAQGQGEAVLVVRQGWRAVVHRLTPQQYRWARSLLDGQTLELALQAASPGFDFSAWLVEAVRLNWLKGVNLDSD